MTHLSPEQLQARLDDALEGRELEEADRHLEGCAACREALAGLVAGDEALSDALTHDPGDRYFETFAARVEDRLRAEGLRGAQSRLGGEDRWFGWLRSPQRLAWIGGIAVVVAGAAIVATTSKDRFLPAPGRDARLADRMEARETAPAAPEPTAFGGPATSEPAAPTAANEAAPAPAPAEPGTVAPMAAKLEAESKQSQADAAAPAGERAAAPARLQPTTRSATGREVAERDARFAAPPAASALAPEAAPRPEGSGIRVRRDRTAGLAQKSATEPVPAPLALDESAATAEAVAGACGTVADAAGRALAGAVIVHVASGRSTTSDAAGRFCLPGGTSGEVAVLAVGYEPARLALGDGPLAATLRAVSVMDGGLAAREKIADEARAREADARYRAWKAAPTPALADSARRALVDYVLRAPAGPAREAAVKRLAEVAR